MSHACGRSSNPVPVPSIRALRLVPAALALGATLAACGEAPVVSRQAPPADPVGRKEADLLGGDALMLVRTPSAPRGERGGTTLQFDAVLLKKNGKVHSNERHLAFTSTDTMVATVDSRGRVTAQDVGRTLLVAEYKDRDADTVTIDVRPVPVAKVELTGVETLFLDDTAQFTAVPLDSVGEPLLGRTTTWSSFAPTIASVSSTGEVVALALGATEITATIDEGSARLNMTVLPQPVAKVVVTPATTSLPQFHKASFGAVAYDKRDKVLAGRAIAWASSAPATLDVNATTGSAVAKDVGAAMVTATAEGVSGSAAVTVTNPVEARALWVTRFEYTLSNAVRYDSIVKIIQKAASANFNVIYFQVRTSGDALYFSDLEPCSPRMCGVLGRTSTRPAQDPLDVALAEAAKYGIEVHAWLNAYTGFIAGSTTACNQFVTSTPANWLKARPDWSVSTKNFTTGAITRQVDNCVGTSEYMWVSPGVPEVRTQLARVSADIARRYGPKGLKGIHLDRIRYPSNQVSYDQPSQDAYRAVYGTFPTSNANANWLNMRRGFVNQGVREVYDSLRSVNPAMVLSAAVFPGYQPRSGWSAQWSFTDLFQDPQAWAQGGYLDVEVPMNYPATATSASWTVKAYCSNTDWTCVMDDHIQRIERGAGRHVYVGVGAIRGWDEMKRQIDLAHDRAATGMSVYSYNLVNSIPNAWAQLAAGPFKHKATLPAMSWK